MSSLFSTSQKTDTTTNNNQSGTTQNNLFNNQGFQNFLNGFSRQAGQVGNVHVDPSAATGNAATAQGTVAGGLAPGITAANNAASGNTYNSTSYQPYMSQYTGAVTDALQKQFGTALDKAGEVVDGHSASQGALGNSNNANARREAIAPLLQNQEAQLAQVQQQGFNTANENAKAAGQFTLSGAGAAGSLAGAATGANSALGTLGQEQFGQGVTSATLPYTLQNQVAQGWGSLGNMAGTNYSGQSNGFSNSTQTNTPSPFSIASGILGAAASFMADGGRVGHASGGEVIDLDPILMGHMPQVAGTPIDPFRKGYWGAGTVSDDTADAGKDQETLDGHDPRLAWITHGDPMLALPPVEPRVMRSSNTPMGDWVGQHIDPTMGRYVSGADRAHAAVREGVNTVADAPFELGKAFAMQPFHAGDALGDAMLDPTGKNITRAGVQGLMTVAPALSSRFLGMAGRGAAALVPETIAGKTLAASTLGGGMLASSASDAGDPFSPAAASDRLGSIGGRLKDIDAQKAANTFNKSMDDLATRWRVAVDAGDVTSANAFKNQYQALAKAGDKGTMPASLAGAGIGLEGALLPDEIDAARANEAQMLESTAVPSAASSAPPLEALTSQSARAPLAERVRDAERSMPPQRQIGKPTDQPMETGVPSTYIPDDLRSAAVKDAQAVQKLSRPRDPVVSQPIEDASRKLEKALGVPEEYKLPATHVMMENGQPRKIADGKFDSHDVLVPIVKDTGKVSPKRQDNLNEGKISDPTDPAYWADKPTRGQANGGMVQRYADGGVTGYDAVRHHGEPVITGAVNGSSGGREDALPVSVPSGSFVIPSDVVSALGTGNTASGFSALEKMFGKSSPQDHANGGKAVPIKISAGEFVLSPQQVTSVGKGDMSLGHNTLDKMVLGLRKEHIKTLKGLPGPSR